MARLKESYNQARQGGQSAKEHCTACLGEERSFPVADQCASAKGREGLFVLRLHSLRPLGVWRSAQLAGSTNFVNIFPNSCPHSL